MTAESIALALGGMIRKPGGGAMACCPAHDDRTASLSIDDADNGGVLVKCFAGCPQDAVVSALKDRGIWPVKDKPYPPTQVKQQVVARFEYRDESGTVYWKERLEPGRDGRAKEFIFYHGNRQTGRGCKPILYHLPEVLTASTVFICEGELKADIVKSWGLTGTSLDSGANSSITSAMIDTLTGKHIVILPDNDEPGHAYAAKFYAALHGKAASIKVVQLDGLPVKGDIVDWIKTPGNGKDRLLDLVQQEQERDLATEIKYEATRSLFISASDLMGESIAYRKLVGKLVERGCTGQLFGPSGDGKTFVALDMTLAIATGILWNGIQCETGLVLYFAGEGHHGLKRRIRAWSKHNGNPALSRFHVSRSTISFDAASIRQITTEVRALEETTGEKVAFIVIDTLARHLQGDENSTRDMSEFIRAVDGLRGSFPDSTAMIVHHSGNDAEKQNRSRGSSALKAAMDFEIQCMKGLLTFTKVKDGATPDPIEFKLVPVEIGTDEDSEPITSCIVEYGERSAKHKQTCMTADERMLYDLVQKQPDIHSDVLRASFYEKRKEHDPGAKQDTIRKAFTRALDHLVIIEILHRDGNIISPRTPDNTRTKPDNSGRDRPDKPDTPYKGVRVSGPLSGYANIPIFESDDEVWV